MPNFKDLEEKLIISIQILSMPVDYQQYNLQVSNTGFHLKYTSYQMLRCGKAMLQYYQYSIHSKDWLLLEETPTG